MQEQAALKATTHKLASTQPPFRQEIVESDEPPPQPDET